MKDKEKGSQRGNKKNKFGTWEIRRRQREKERRGCDKREFSWYLKEIEIKIEEREGIEKFKIEGERKSEGRDGGRFDR